MRAAGLSARVVPIPSSELQRARAASRLLDPAQRARLHARAPPLARGPRGVPRRPHHAQRGERRMKRILVTGGCGFIGSHFVRRMLARHPQQLSRSQAAPFGFL